MKKDTLKEIGKFGLDLSKIIFAIAILPTILKNGIVNGYALLGALTLTISGIMLINKGAENE
ncbi:MAG: hypothetical protein GXO49_01355 [Chlorobi bacterium]|nr:hypothetical protein [Chlorobiota bacterium]